ncbi:MAG: glycosyltransferase [Acidobacteriota bacterium]
MSGPAATIARVIRGEGIASAMRRTTERVTEAWHGATLRARGTFARAGNCAILNVSAAGVATRLGGVQTQLATRLREERTLRDVALLYQGVLELSAPFPHAHRISPFAPTRALFSLTFERALGEAMAMTAARTVHLEGTDGVPIGSVLRLAESGARVVISVHDFSLFCARPHLLEQPMERFCFYSHDLERCLRCLSQSWETPRDAQSERRDLARRLLTSAAGVIFPSRVLFDRHRDLFSLPEMKGAVVEPGAPGPEVRLSSSGPRSAIAYAGSVQRHKGAHLMPEIIRRSAAEIDWHIFGGGDEDLLRAMRRLPNVTIHGYYRPGRLPSLLARHRIGLVVLPSIVPESHGLILSEARLAGIAATAFDLGALAERIGQDGGGWLAPLESGAAGLATIVEQWHAGQLTTNVPAAPSTPLAAAQAHVDLYRQWGC